MKLTLLLTLCVVRHVAKRDKWKKSWPTGLIRSIGDSAKASSSFTLFRVFDIQWRRVVKEDGV